MSDSTRNTFLLALMHTGMGATVIATALEALIANRDNPQKFDQAAEILRDAARELQIVHEQLRTDPIVRKYTKQTAFDTV